MLPPGLPQISSKLSANLVQPFSQLKLTYRYIQRRAFLFICGVPLLKTPILILTLSLDCPQKLQTTFQSSLSCHVLWYPLYTLNLLSECKEIKLNTELLNVYMLIYILKTDHYSQADNLYLRLRIRIITNNDACAHMYNDTVKKIYC